MTAPQSHQGAAQDTKKLTVGEEGKSNKRKLERNEDTPDLDKEARKRQKRDRKEAKKLKRFNKQQQKILVEKLDKSKDLSNAINNEQVIVTHNGADLQKMEAVFTGKDSSTKSGDSNSRTKIAGGVIHKHSLESLQNYTQDPSLSAVPQHEIEKFLADNGISVAQCTNGQRTRPILKFSYLPSSIIKGRSILAKFSAPTPIQAVAWPFLLSGRDVVGVAETGSGKTLAFGIPLIQFISNSHLPSSCVQAVIVSPTRELAMQIHGQMEELASSAQLRAVCVYGGVPKEDQRKALKTASIITATPGRLNDLVEEGSADLSSVRYLVLDEADRMLDKGFEDEIRKIIGACSRPERQTLMFTATWPPSVRDLASTFMKDAVQITIGHNNPTGELRANRSITQVVEVIDPSEKQFRLIQLLKKHQSKDPKHLKRILIFTLYKKEAARIDSFLRSQRFHVAAIHGDMSQAMRTSSLEGFRTGACPLLVATDVAARGLDIPEVQLVINLTFPLTAEDYVHRIGRTGRGGNSGLAITLFTEHDKALAGSLVNVLKAADQPVPESLLKFGTTVRKKGHDAYGAFYKDIGAGDKKHGTKIRFD